MPRKRTAEEYKVLFDYNNSSRGLVLMSDYTGSKNKVVVKCLNCMTTWEAIAENVLKRTGCPTCAMTIKADKISSSKKLKPDVFYERVRSLGGGDYEAISPYSSAKEKVWMKHVSCGLVYQVAPDEFNSGSRCPECARKVSVLRKTQAEFEEEVRELSGNDYLVLGTYVNWKTKVALLHVSCGSIIEIEPNGFIQGRRCSVCSRSNGERLIREVLDNSGTPYEEQKKFPDLKNKNNLSYDFYLPESDILIEYQGKQHYEPIAFFGGEENFKKQRINDELKRTYAKEKGLYLVEIPYQITSKEGIEKVLHSFLKK